MTYLSNKELETKKAYNEWTDLLPQIRKVLNKYRKKPDGDPFALTHILKTNKIPKYKIGDIVIPKLEVPKDALGNKETTENFRNGDVRFDLNYKLKIVRVLNYPNNNRYILNTLPNVSYAEEELMSANINDEYHQVKNVIDVDVEDGKIFYKIHWEGHLKQHSTWVSKTSLIKDRLKKTLLEFDKKHKEKKGKKS